MMIFCKVKDIGNKKYILPSLSLTRKYLFLVFLLLCTSCSVNKKAIILSELKGYNSTYENSILLLTFEISKTKSKEKVELINAQIASGKLKNIGSHFHSARSIKTVAYFSDEDSLLLENEHPLYRVAEVPNIDGSIEKTSISDTKGTLFIRIQQKPNLQKIVLYSADKNRNDEKIYELKFKL